MMRGMRVTAQYVAVAPPLRADVSDGAWRMAPVHSVVNDWQGAPAPPELAVGVRVCWTPTDLWFAFECRYVELDVDSGPIDTTVERVGLWDRDVCEAFVWHPGEPRDDSYKEFEVAPTGQWCDLAIHRPRLDVDWRWNSGMRTAGAVEAPAGVWRAVMAVPFAAFGAVPAAGDRWRVNLFRIGRFAGERRYMSYAPTGTATPDFHVPGCFVPLEFVAP